MRFFLLCRKRRKKATTNLIPVHTGKDGSIIKMLRRGIGCVENPHKTEKGNLISCYQCDPRTAAEECWAGGNMLFVQNAACTGMTWRFIFAAILQPGGNSPEEANRLGNELAGKKGFRLSWPQEIAQYKSLSAEYEQQFAEKRKLYAEYQRVHADMQEMLIVRANMETDSPAGCRPKGTGKVPAKYPWTIPIQNLTQNEVADPTVFLFSPCASHTIVFYFCFLNSFTSDRYSRP